MKITVYDVTNSKANVRDYMHADENRRIFVNYDEKDRILIDRSKEWDALNQENEILRAANDDLNKELRILKNCKEVDVDHPSNKFF